MDLSPEAKKFYDEWQRVREDEWTASNDGFCMQIHSRLAPTVVKLGMLFELGSSDFDPARPVRLQLIQEACRLVDAYFMPRLGGLSSGWSQRREERYRQDNGVPQEPRRQGN